MIKRMVSHLIVLLLFFLIIENSVEQPVLGTHFYVNQDNILIDNTFKTVSTLARPYDLVAFIRQSERLARVDHLQTYIDAVDETVENSSDQQQQSLRGAHEQEKDGTIDQCHEFIRDSESLIFKTLRTHLYDTFHIPFELKNLSNDLTINDKSHRKISTCQQFCQIKTSKPSLLRIFSVIEIYIL